MESASALCTRSTKAKFASSPELYLHRPRKSNVSLPLASFRSFIECLDAQRDSIVLADLLLYTPKTRWNIRMLTELAIEELPAAGYKASLLVPSRSTTPPGAQNVQTESAGYTASGIKVGHARRKRKRVPGKTQDSRFHV